MTRKEITELAQLSGKKVAVLTETGQTSVTARLTIENAGATATYVPLVKFDRIFAALVAREIDGGALPRSFQHPLAQIPRNTRYKAPTNLTGKNIWGRYTA